MENKIELYSDPKACCGCGACMSICHKQAISMKEDLYGFLYPVIDYKNCISCGMCNKVCAFQNKEEKNVPIATFVAARKDNNRIKQSASGGIFAAVAEEVIKSGGVVFGAAMENVGGILTPMHIMVDKLSDLPRIQGSKYVQSDIGGCYRLVKDILIRGKGQNVLFSGTPCQIAGLNEYLKQSYERLLTMDIICHGVPNARFFQGYISQLEYYMKSKVIDFKFRDKQKGWGLTAKAIFEKEDKHKFERLIPCGESSYYSLFLKSEIYRENCYYCKYTNGHRPSDITVGDYWGIQRLHPELMEENGGRFSERKGISVVIVNTNKGMCILDKCKDAIDLSISTFEKAASENEQLNKPSTYGKHRDRILECFITEEYIGVERYFRRINRINLLMFKVKQLLPKKLKKWIKKLLFNVKNKKYKS